MAKPTLLLTRPRASAQAFAARLDPVALGRVDVLLAPLMEISDTGAPVDIPPDQAVIFTSANGVAQAGAGAGRPAFCVGENTTRQAGLQGWRAQQAGETAQALIAALIADPPQTPLLHLGGEHTRGDIAGALSAAGLPTQHIALYRQTLLPLEPNAKAALEKPCIIPVFSPRTAAQLVTQAAGKLALSHIVALSDAVAAPFRGENLAQLHILPAPQAIYMVNAVENLCLSHALP